MGKDFYYKINSKCYKCLKDIQWQQTGPQTVKSFHKVAVVGNKTAWQEHEPSCSQPPNVEIIVREIMHPFHGWCVYKYTNETFHVIVAIFRDREQATEYRERLIKEEGCIMPIEIGLKHTF